MFGCNVCVANSTKRVFSEQNVEAILSVKGAQFINFLWHTYLIIRNVKNTVKNSFTGTAYRHLLLIVLTNMAIQRLA